MLQMFFVRAPPSRVLLLLRRCVVVGGRPPSPRSEIDAHSTRTPVLRCSVGSLFLQSVHRCMGRELGGGHVCHVQCTCSSIPRVAALASPHHRRWPSLIPSLRDRRSLHTAARPSLRCSLPLPSTRTSARGASNRLRRPMVLTWGLHSHRLRCTSRNGRMELWPAVQRNDASGSTTMIRQRCQRRCSDFTERERERERERR